MAKRIVVISDLQVPFHDRRTVELVAQFIDDYQPDEVVSVGDVLDAPQVSRWNKGMRGEYEGTLSRQRDEATRVLERLQVNTISRSNHDERIENYIQKYAPGLGDLPELRIESFLRLGDLGITFHRKPIRVAPGWLVMHGDEGGLSPIPGSTALGLVKRTGMSVAAGHTHRSALKPHTEAFSGKARTKWAMEVGHLMDMGKAHYLKSGGANWQQAFGILTVEGQNVYPHLVPVVKGSFVVDGHRWSA